VHIVIDRDGCQGHGLCFLFAPDLFGPDEQGHGRVIVDDVPAERRADCIRVVQNCPERAIGLTEDNEQGKRVRDVRDDD
jgi:ferredoxin